MRFTRAGWVRAFAFGAAFFAASALVVPALRAADEVDAKITAMKDFEKKGDDGKCIAAMQELKDLFGDTRVYKAIKDLIGSKNDRIAVAAVKMIAGKTPKDVEFLKWICGKIDKKSPLYDDKDKGGNHELVCAYLDAIPLYKADKGAQATIKSALPKLEDVVNKFLATNAEFATRAIRAYACVRDKFAMEQLLKWGEQTEARGGGGGGGGGGKSMSTEQKEIMNKSKFVILACFGEMTGKEQPDVAAWAKWWKENQKTFVFPEPGDPSLPEKPIAGAVIPEGAEYKDEAYGYTVKRPEVEGWSFIKPDYNGPRVAISYSAPGDPKYVLARAYIEVYNTTKNPPRDVKGLVEWVKDKPIKEQVDTHDKEPEVKEVKGPSIDWTFVKALGDGIGIKQGWGTIERRFYLVKYGDYMLWVDSFVRLGAEPEVKDALWKSIESMTLPPPPKK